MFSFDTTPTSGYYIPAHAPFFGEESPIDRREFEEIEFDPANLLGKRTVESLPSPPLERVNQVFASQIKRAKTEDSEEASSLFAVSEDEIFDFEDIDGDQEDVDNEDSLKKRGIDSFSPDAEFSLNDLASPGKKMKGSDEDSSESSSEPFSPLSPPILSMNFKPKVATSKVRLRDKVFAERPLHHLVRHSNFLLDALEEYSYACSRDISIMHGEKDLSKKRQYEKRADIYDVISAQAEQAGKFCDEAIKSRIEINELLIKSGLLSLGFMPRKK